MPNLMVILGGGGHARVLLDCLGHDSSVEVRAVLDSNSRLWGTTCLGINVIGDDSRMDELIAGGVTHFAVGLGGTANTSPRQRLFEFGLSRALEPVTVVHPSAVRSHWASIGQGCQLFPGSVVNAGAELGVNVIVNTGAIVEHDCRVGDHVHLATGAKLSGAVVVGARSHVGAGAVVRQSIVIGEDAVVGAGAVVVKDVERGAVLVGNPAQDINARRRDGSAYLDASGSPDSLR